MFTGKMTATWLILLTIAGCAAVPVLLIYYTTVHPFIETHPPKITLGLVDLIPNAIMLDFTSTIST
jgi:predicted tellurium resistance membrane protein TerC